MLVLARPHKKSTQTLPNKAFTKEKDESASILVLNTMADILRNSSESFFHGEYNGILSIGALMSYH
jgi:hypothetical protein